QVIRLMGPADLIGMAPVVGDTIHSTRATALTDGFLCSIPGETVRELLSTSTDFALAVLGYLARDLRVSEDFLMVMTQRPVRRRVADVLLLLHGHTVHGDDWDPLPAVQLKRKEIASMVGTTPETVSRLLADFAAEGLIRLTRVSLELLNAEGLQTVAGEETLPD
ncbi:hypothetical protein DRQ50_12255, partial [bacterium]